MANVAFHFWLRWHFEIFELLLPADIYYFTYYISSLNNGTNLQHYNDSTSISMTFNPICCKYLFIRQSSISINLSILNQIISHCGMIFLEPSSKWILTELFDIWRWERNHTRTLNTVMRPMQWIKHTFLIIKINFDLIFSEDQR